MTSLTREQRAVVRRLLKGRDNHQTQSLGGYAGTGKTTVLAHLADALPDWTPCAFTGKAAHVMQRKGMAAATIHSSIYNPIPLPGGGVEFRLKLPWEVGCAGFLVDEASMVSRDLYDDLLSFGLPVIFVGDHGQLPPVGSDVNLMADPMYRLETIHRNAGEVAFFCQHLRHGKNPRRFPADGRVVVVGPNDVTDDLLLNAGQVICAFNKTRVGVNYNVRKLRHRKGQVAAGDRMICLRNSRTAGLFNGQQGKVLRVHVGNPPRLDLKSSRVVYEGLPYDPATFYTEKPELTYDPSAPHPFDFAYAVTCHKSQGSEWNKVLVYEQGCRLWEPARWNYTAASRARRRLWWVATPRMVGTRI